MQSPVNARGAVFETPLLQRYQLTLILRIAKQEGLQGIACHSMCSRTQFTTCKGLKGLTK